MREVRPLRHHRLARGWSLDDVAKHLVEIGHEVGEDNLGVSGIMVGRWERGERNPAPPYPKLLCALYQATAWELGIVEEGSQNAEPCGRLEDVDRREILHLLPAALTAPVLLRGEGADRLAHALSRPSRVDPEAASVVEAAIANVRRLDDVSGSRVAVRPALAQRDVIRTLLRGRPSGAVAERLTVAAAELSQLLGWLALQINEQATSRRYYGEALEFAHEAGADTLSAYVLGHLSVLVGGGRGRAFGISRDGLHEGVAFAQAGASRAEANGSAAIRCWLAGVEAEALSNLGDLTGAERALDRARTAFARFRPEDEPPWMYYYGMAELEGHFGAVYLALDRPGPARRAIEQTLETLDPSMVRDRARHLARLAETYVPDGEVEEACRLGGEALTVATDTQSDRVVLRVRKLRGQLESWASEPMVRELDDQLAATASWFHPISA